ncbi:MAG: hypothetical protein FJ291_33900, partial [Planctomycetes bacterium]|nr:hypothetical protein [Planctomycetota bacterium]
MRKALWLCLAVATAASAALAGGPPGRRDGERGGPPDRGRFGGFDMFRGDALQQRARGNAFDALRRYFDLTPEQQAAVAKLDEQRAGDERDAQADLAKRLDKKYSALILEVLPADQKPKYEGVLAALAARDDAIEAAQKDFRGVVEKTRTAQGVTGAARQRGFFGAFGGPGAGLPNDKGDIISQCINLTEQQRGAVDGIRRDGGDNMRNKMRDVARPQDWRDADARQKYADAMRKVREQVDTQTAEAMALLLDPEQKKAYEGAAGALDAYKKKV